MSSRAIYLMTLVLLCCTSTVMAADNPFKPFRADYIVERDDEVIARTTLSLSASGNNRWRYRSSSEPTGWFASMLGAAVDEESEWTWADGLKILSYRYDRSGKEKHVQLLFNWQTMRVTNTINGDPWQMDIPDGTQDKLSINLALMAHLSRSEADISFPVADGGKLKTYDFKVIGRETISTALGNIQTVKVSRNKRGRKDRQATLWLAPDLNYLLVQMEKAESDDEMLILKIQSIN